MSEPIVDYRELQRYFDNIKYHIQTQCIYNSIEEIPIHSPNFLNFFKHSRGISSAFDFICAFYSEEDQEIEIELGDRIFKQKLRARVYTIPICNIIPLLCIRGIYININCHKDVSTITGKCTSDTIKNFILNNNIYTEIFTKEEEIIMYFNSSIFITTLEKYLDTYSDTYKDIRKHTLRIPQYYTENEEYREYLAHKMTDMIRYELLEKTMAPNRLRSFMSIDDLVRYNIRSS